MLILFIIIIIIIIILSCRSARYGTGRNVKVQFKSQSSGHVVYSGNGLSIGDAMVDGFYKMYNSITENSRIDTIESRYNGMRNALRENRSRMKPEAISQCERYISLTYDLLYRKKNKKQLEAERKLREKKEEEERLRAEAKKYEKLNKAHKEYVAFQRRLLSDSMRYNVLARDNFRCQICGAAQKDGVTLHVDHILPVSKGGRTEMSNLRTLCERCNMGKRDKIENVPLVSAQEDTDEICKPGTDAISLDEFSERYT